MAAAGACRPLSDRGRSGDDPCHAGRSCAKRLATGWWLAADAMNWKRKSWVWAVLALLTALSWQAITAGILFGGDWTGLYYSGDRFPLPPEMDGTIFRHQGSAGYDAQFYLLAAHDPFNLKHYSKYMDNAVYRRKRALIPLLAWAAGLGQPRLIEWSYIAVLNGFVLLGAWLFAELARGWERHPAWGMTFLLMPATLNGMDRMLPDLTLSAAMAGFVLYRGRRPMVAWTCLAAAVLTRELGLLLVAAAVGHELWQRRWRLCAVWAAAIVPALAWWSFCSGMRGSGAVHSAPGWLWTAPVYGFIIRAVEPVGYDTTHAWIFQTLDAAVMLALPVAAGMAVWRWWENRDEELEWLAMAGACLVVAASNKYFLGDSASYPRTFNLLVCPLALIALRTWRWRYAVPCGLLSTRLLLGYIGILSRSVFGVT
mgnify:CR=1 FL=1